MVSADTIFARAKLYRTIREYLDSQGVIEVDVPILGASTVTDPFIQSLSLRFNDRRYFLQTSPEFFLKRLLCQYQQSVYSLTKVFRAEEIGRHHNPEFTMLEWYRRGFNERELIQDVLSLIKQIQPNIQSRCMSYRDVFIAAVGVDPHEASWQDLKCIAEKNLCIEFDSNQKSLWLDLLFTHLVEPKMFEGITAVFDYPACQSALARLEEDEKGEQIAKRFEVFWNGLEIANGYWELTDADIQRERFEQDNSLRRAMGIEELPIDERFISALKQGLPDCSGVALGVDRILMCILGVNDITHVLNIAWQEL